MYNTEQMSSELAKVDGSNLAIPKIKLNEVIMFEF